MVPHPISQVGIHVEGVDLVHTRPPSASGIVTFDPSASVILIGMRGVGKTLVGKLAAASLGWNTLDADAYFETTKHIGVREFVAQQGWPAFRAAETEILQGLLTNEETAKCHIISLGGGIVETPAAMEMLQAYVRKGGPVVHVVRQAEEVVKYLEDEKSRPAFGEPVEAVMHRREPWYQECSNFEYPNHTGDVNSLVAIMSIQKEISRFFGHITGVKDNLVQSVKLGERSYFLSLTYPDITEALSQMEQLTIGVDAVELRVDLLRPANDRHRPAPYVPPTSYVRDQIASIRRSTGLPIVFTVRTVSQGGAFPDTAEREAFELMNLALRWGVEYVDVEISWPVEKIRSLTSRKRYSQVIASWHDWSGNMKWNGPQVKEKYDLANDLGDIIKIVGKANSVEDNFELRHFVSRVNSVPDSKPIIAINMGLEGQLSRILNTTLTPVTQPHLPFEAAPGQLTPVEIHQALHLIGQLPARQYYLFGHPISESMSPILHNTGFQVLGLPHTYTLLETTDVGDDIKSTIRSPEFGGASVTIPFKLDVIPLLDKLSPAAEAIGAVNTIIPFRSPTASHHTTLYGDNTDWMGICAVVRAKLSWSPLTVDEFACPKAGLVIGAGGTARAAIYALRVMGVKIVYLYNRTRSKAEALRRVFSDVNVVVLDWPEGASTSAWPDGGGAPSIIISTVPASSTTTTTAGDESGKLVIPRGFFDAERGVVVDMAYKPAETPLLQLARSIPGGRWQAVQGLDVLLEQGYEQFKLWTRRDCPKTEVSQRVWGKYNSKGC
jgi:pentafunctional AROM polypeptide